MQSLALGFKGDPRDGLAAILQSLFKIGNETRHVYTACRFHLSNTNMMKMRFHARNARQMDSEVDIQTSVRI